MNNSRKIFEFLKKKGCSKVFSIVGGHALFLNEASHSIFKKNVFYFHNEQSLTLAADSFSRISKIPGIVCVTSGPAALNCLNGVYGAYVDSIPMIILSGQPRTDNIADALKIKLRQYGDQEFSKIHYTVKNMVKYSTSLRKNSNILFEIEKAYKIATTSRPGPVWIDIPIDIQKAEFTLKQRSFYPSKIKLSKRINKSIFEKILKKIKASKRPVIYAGTEIEALNCKKKFKKLIRLLNIPVVTEWNAHDLIDSKEKLNVGRPGFRGNRIGNAVVYKSDLVMAIGTNLSIRQVGGEARKFSPHSYLIMINNDLAELKKPNVKPDYSLNYELNLFLDSFIKFIKKTNYKENFKYWLGWCKLTEKKFLEYSPDYKKTKKLNPYIAIKEIFRILPKNKITIAGNGISVVGPFQVAEIKKNDRLYQNVGCASMGYDLPATIGAGLASKKKIICFTGDGSFQFNIQELQTIKQLNLNVCIFVVNNNGYFSIKQSQRAFSKSSYHGVDETSGVSFPNLEKISKAYGFAYFKIKEKKQIERAIRNGLQKKQAIIEVVVDEHQSFQPKVLSSIDNQGKFKSDNLFDMSPKIDKRILDRIMSLPEKLK